MSTKKGWKSNEKNWNVKLNNQDLTRLVHSLFKNLENLNFVTYDNNKIKLDAQNSVIEIAKTANSVFVAAGNSKAEMIKHKKLVDKHIEKDAISDNRFLITEIRLKNLLASYNLISQNFSGFNKGTFIKPKIANTIALCFGYIGWEAIKAKVKIESEVFFEEFDLSEALLKSNYKASTKEQKEALSKRESVLYGYAPQLPKYFIGREEELKYLKEWVCTKSESSSRIIIRGVLGIGKSILISKVVQENTNNLNNILWINNASDLISSTLESGFSFLLDNGYKPNEVSSSKENFLIMVNLMNRATGHNLMIVDNFDTKNNDYADHTDFFLKSLPSTGNWKFIFITNEKYLELDASTFEIKKLDEPLLQNLYVKYSGFNITELGNFSRLLAMINHNTLVIKILAKNGKEHLNRGYIKGGNDYSDLLLTKPFIRNEKLNRYKINNALGFKSGKLIDILLNTFNFDSLTNDEKSLLFKLALLPSIPISENLIEEIFENSIKNIPYLLQTLDETGWIEYLGNGNYQLHQLMRSLVVNRTDIEKKYYERLFKVIGEKHKSELNYKQRSEIFILSEFIINEFNFISVEFLRLGLQVSEQLALYGSFDIAQVIIDRIGTNYKKLKNKDLGILANIYLNKGIISLGKGQAEIAINFYKKAIEALNQSSEKDSLEYAKIYNHISYLYINYDPLKAIDFSNKSIAQLDQQNDKHLPYIAAAQCNLGDSLNALGRFREALPLFEDAIQIFKKVPKTDGSSLSTAYSSKANTLREIMEYDEALKYYKEALMIDKEIYLPENANIIVSYFNIGYLYLFMKDFGNAKEFLLETLKRNSCCQYPVLKKEGIKKLLEHAERKEVPMEILDLFVNQAGKSGYYN